MDIDYQRLFEATPTPYLIVTPDLRIVAVNEAYLSATMTRRDELLGRHMFDAFPDNPADPTAHGVRNLRASFERVLASGAPDVMAFQKYDIRRGPGADASFEERYWSPINSPVFGPDGSIEMLIHRVEDVTEFVRVRHAEGERQRFTEELRRRAEETEADLFQRARELVEVNHLLRLANEELTARGGDLRREQEAKDRFLATLSHELRNPLTAIRGALEILDLDLGEDDSETRRMCDVIGRQTSALVKMTDDLLDATRAVVGKLELERRPLDLALLVASSIQDARQLFEAGGRLLSLVLPDEPVRVEGDEVRLAQALGNLLHNARKFTEPAGRVSVELSVAGATAVVRVTDDGAGFSPSCAEQLFGVFAQGDGSSTRRTGGIGLGLAIVRSIVDLHGGRVTAHSDGPGKGATFTIMLPALPAEALTATEARPPDASGATPLRVLLVEDDADIAITYRSLLSRLGHHAEVAPSGLCGIQVATQSIPDVVLCDIGLPDIDGYELARRLRGDARTAHVRLVAVSGYGQEADRLRSAEAGFDEHLVKPLSRSALAEALRIGARRPGPKIDQ